MRKTTYSWIGAAFRRTLECRMCRHVGAYAVLSVLVIEGAILIPSYWNHERDLLSRLESTGRAEILATHHNAASAGESDLPTLERLLGTPGSNLLGAILYRGDGSEMGRIGSPPELTLERARSQGLRRLRSADGRALDVLWEADENGMSPTIAARLDAAWVAAEMDAFVWRIIGLVLLISGFVSAVIMAILGRSVLLPLLRLRASLVAACDNPARADTFVLEHRPDNEIGEAMEAANRLLGRVARTYREELATMNAMARQASDAILAYDAGGRLLYANPACLLLCGFSDTAEMAAAGFPRLRFTDPEGDLTLAASLAQGAYSREAVLVARDGHEMPVYVNAARPPGGADAPVQFYASITDITELDATRERLRGQNLELHSANRARTEFLTNMSHELRTPLNAIIGFSEVLRDGLFGPLGNPRYTEYAEDIHASGVHLLAIINDILDLAKIDADKMELHESDIAIPELIEAVLPIVRGRAETGELALGVTLADDLPHLHGDPRAVKQILINLLSNAIKFTEPGGQVTISASYERGTIVLAVADTGIGIAEADLPAAFSTFGQVDASLDRKHEGTGLGLPLVTALAELHGAVFKLDSTPGVGTEASVTFPSRRTIGAPVLDGVEATPAERPKNQSVA
jgi:PAS domain S-box-containing protein